MRNFCQNFGPKELWGDHVDHSKTGICTLYWQFMQPGSVDIKKNFFGQVGVEVGVEVGIGEDNQFGQKVTLSRQAFFFQIVF